MQQTDQELKKLWQAFLRQVVGAKRRGVPWRLKFEEWLTIWTESGHLHERGRKAGQWVMGRNGDIGAYKVGNVKIIRVEENNHDAGKRKKPPIYRRLSP